MRLDKRLRFLVAVPLATVLLVSSASADSLGQKVLKARDVYKQLITSPDREVPQQLLSESRCVAVIPGVIKAAWIIGARHGRGLMSCKSNEGRWSPPLFLSFTGGSIGWQAGLSSTDVVLFFMSDRGVRSLLASEFTLSAEAGLAAGPVGRVAEAGTDLNLNAEIYSYARSRGLFAGVSLEGSRLAADPDRTWRYYDKDYSAQEVLFEQAVEAAPPSARSFTKQLPAVSDF